MYEVIGMQHRHYVSKKTGKDVDGWNVFVVYEEDGVEGRACMSVWLNDEQVKKCEVGSLINVLYNRYGSVQSVELVG